MTNYAGRNTSIKRDPKNNPFNPLSRQYWLRTQVYHTATMEVYPYGGIVMGHYSVPFKPLNPEGLPSLMMDWNARAYPVDRDPPPDLEYETLVQHEIAVLAEGEDYAKKYYPTLQFH